MIICNFCTYFICDNKQFWDNKYVRPVYNQTVLPLTHTLLTLHIKTFVLSQFVAAHAINSFKVEFLCTNEKKLRYDYMKW